MPLKSQKAKAADTPVVPLTLPQGHVELVAAPPPTPPPPVQFRIDGNPMLEAALALAKRKAEDRTVPRKTALVVQGVDNTPSFEAFFARCRRGYARVRPRVEARAPAGLDCVYVADAVFAGPGPGVVVPPRPLREAELPDVAVGPGSPLALTLEKAAHDIGAWVAEHVTGHKDRRLVGGLFVARTDFQMNGLSQTDADRAFGAGRDFLRAVPLRVVLYSSTPGYCKAIAKAFDPFGEGVPRVFDQDSEDAEDEFLDRLVDEVVRMTETACRPEPAAGRYDLSRND